MVSANTIRGRSKQAGALLTLTALMVALGLAVLPSAHATQNVTTKRYGGGDRFETARLLAEHAFPSGVQAVLLARAQDFPDGTQGFADALAGTYLAGYFGSPILLTNQDSVPAPTLTALKDMKVQDVVILGGTGAVSDSVTSQLSSTPSSSAAGGNLVVSRIAGADRYQTADLIAEFPPTSFVGSVGGKKTVLVARGDQFADALAGGPLADASHLPLVLTETDHLDPAAQKTLQQLQIQNAIILGGGSAVSTATEQQIQALGITTQRLAGSNRQLTAAAIADFALGNLGFKANLINLARGDNYPDALAGGPEAATTGPYVIVLTSSPTDLSVETASWIRSRNLTINEVDAYGLQGAISDAVLAQAAGPQGATCQGPTTSTTSPLPTIPGTSSTTAVSPSSTLGVPNPSTTTTLPPCTPASTTSTVGGTSSTSTTVLGTSTTTSSTTPPTTMCLPLPVPICH